MDYHYGNKKQWRRWLWNRIAERTAGRDGLVLFLAGEAAPDIEVAERHGFKRRNMLAVETNRAVRERLRESGVLTIDGDLCDVLRTWPRARRIDVVVADFCCGLEQRIVDQMTWPSNSQALADTTMAVNLLRGRDPSTTATRAKLMGAPKWLWLDEKHRGGWFWMLFAGAHSFNHLRPGEVETVCEDGTAEAALQLVKELSRPAFYSYKSSAGSQIFDTAVYRNIVGSAVRTGEARNFLSDRGALKLPAADLAQRRRTAAVLAHHTRRLAAA